MLFVRIRRRLRNLSSKFLIILSLFFILSFIIRSDRTTSLIKSERNHLQPRLYCILLNTHSTHERFVYANNITWGKRCDKIGIIRYRRLSKDDEDANPSRIPYHVNLWMRILDLIRQLINSNEDISINDSLVIVLAPTYVFREKIFLLFQNSTHHSQLPSIIIHEQQEVNSYILNGQALNLIHNSEIMDLCLKQSYPSARETHLWKCIKTSLENQYKNNPCQNENCFIQYHSYQLTINHIKNGFCLNNHHHICQTIPLLYPITFNDFLMLEFFKYIVKLKSSNDL